MDVNIKVKISEKGNEKHCIHMIVCLARNCLVLEKGGMDVYKEFTTVRKHKTSSQIESEIVPPQ